MFTGTFQPIHWLVVILVVVLIFGPGKLSQLGSSLGKSIRGFKDALNEKDVTPAPTPAQPQNPQAAQASAEQPKKDA